jgi:alpha-glucosidase
MKYVGIWWGMHLGKYTWNMSEKHGATTENTKAYIDFAAQNGFGGVLVEGWNVGWESPDHDGDWFSYTKPYPDFNLEEICKYGASKNVKFIGHNETYGSVRNYENQMTDAFQYYQKNGINAIKTGYVKKYLDKVEWHDSQYGVRHYRKVIETAAKYNIAIDCHEPIKPTGLQRTYPNLMSQEGARGQEYNAWSSDGGNPPSHLTILPFTRLLAGPLDYTPGVFNFTNPSHPKTHAQSTIVNQLALYIVIYSPLQMACDLPENYKNQKAFDFIKDVPVDWQETKVLNAKIGDYVTIARKDRNSENWYIGSITDENPRELTVSLDFLDPNQKYTAQIYADGDKADFKTNQTAYTYKEQKVTSKTKLTIKLAPGGGQAIRIIKNKK